MYQHDNLKHDKVTTLWMVVDHGVPLEIEKLIAINLDFLTSYLWQTWVLYFFQIFFSLSFYMTSFNYYTTYFWLITYTKLHIILFYL